MDTTTAVLIILVGCIMSVNMYNIVLTTKKNEAMMKAQVESSKVKRTDHINTMKFQDIISIIDILINFYTSEEIVKRNLTNKKEDEISIIIDNMVTDICVSVESAMSQELKSSFMNYSSEQHLRRYITSTIRLNIVARLNVRK